MPARDGGLFHQVRRRAFARQLADFVVGFQQFVQAGAAVIAGAAALAAADGPINPPPALEALGQREILGDVFGGGGELFAALAAERAHQPLGQHALHATAHQKRLHAHVDHPQEGARGIVGVQRGEHEVPGQRGLHGVLGGFQVADFAHQDHVRIVPQNAPQAGGESESHLGVHLDLVDAVEMILDGVLGGDDLGFVALDFVQGAVERGGLAGAGGTGDQHDPVGQLDEALESRVHVGAHADAAQRKVHAVLVQDAHHDAFAVQRGNDRDADVHLAAGRLELDAAVLGHALLGDVQPGHDLQPADDRRMEAVDLRRGRLRVQHAVDAIAYPYAAGLRFEMDVAGTGFDRLDQNLVDQPDHGGLLRGLGGVRAVAFEIAEHVHAAFLPVGLRQKIIDRFRAHAELGLDEHGQLVGRQDHGDDAQAGGGPHGVQGVQVEGIAGGQMQACSPAAATDKPSGDGPASAEMSLIRLRSNFKPANSANS